MEKTERALGSVRLAEFVVLSVPEPASAGVKVKVTVLVEPTARTTDAGVNVPVSVHAGVTVNGAASVVPAVGVTLKRALEPTDRDAGPVNV